MWLPKWTQEEWIDTLIMAGVAAAGAFTMTIIYRLVDAYLKETRWG